MFVFGFLVLLNGGITKAGCHIGPEHDYRDYHHGFVTDEPTTGTQGSFVFVLKWQYFDGELVAVRNSLPPQCDSPECRQRQPNHSLVPVSLNQTSPRILIGSTTSSSRVEFDSLSLDRLPTLDVAGGKSDPFLLERPPRLGR